MQDQEYRVGDRVRIPAIGMNGEIVEVNHSFGAPFYTLNLGDEYIRWSGYAHEISPIKPESQHTCAPYVGVIHVENKCVYCNRHMRDAEINEYLHNKVAI